MNLLKVIQTAQLQYFHRQSGLQVLENQDYIWLTQNHIVQSVMLKRKPWLLPLAHQHFLMLPLCFLQPTRVLEFGLGGGNFLRFLNYYNQSNMWLTCVELSAEVIACAKQFFSISALSCELIQQDASSYIKQQSCCADWLIYDVFRQHNSGGVAEEVIEDCLTLVGKMSATSWLSINMPQITAVELTQLIQALQGRIFGQFQLRCFTVPHYQNVILHLFPTAFPSMEKFKLMQQSWLPNARFKRYWQWWHNQ